MPDPITRSGSYYSAPRDSNRVPTLLGVLNTDGVTPTPLEVNSSGQLLTTGSGGGGGATTIADGVTNTILASVLDLTDSNPLTVAIVNGTGDQITSFGGGTQYTQGGATVANPTGTAEIWFDGSGNPKSVTPSQPLPSNITDGTTAANVVAGDSGFNGVATASATKTYTFTTSASGAQIILANTPSEGFSWVEVYFSSVGSGLALQAQYSNTTSNYINLTSFANGFSAAFNNSVTAGAAVLSYSPIHGNYFQLNVTALTSGTFAGWVIFHNTQPIPSSISATQNGTWTVGSTSATGSAAPANAFYQGIINAAGNLQGIQAASATADGSAGNALVGGSQSIYNGGSFDRIRSATTASNTTGTGLLGVGNLGFDGTNYQLEGVTAANSTTTGTSGVSQLVSGTGFTTVTLTLNSGSPNTGWYDMLNYAWVSVEILTNTTPATLTWQTSGDSSETNIRSTALYDSAAAVNGFTLTSASTNATYSGPRTGRYFRVSSNNGAGTTTLVLTFYSVPSSIVSTNSIGSNSATGSAVPANAFYMAASDATNLVGLRVNISDNTSNSSLLGVTTTSYNNSGWDRTRNNTTGVIIAAGATSGSSVTTTTYNARSMAIIINVSAYTSGTITIAINGITSSGYSYPLISSVTGLAATGVSIYRIGPGLTPSAGLVTNDLLPRSVQVIIGGTFSATFGVDYELSV